LHTLVEKGVPSRVLAKIREQTGLTVKELAEILGVAPRTVGRREQELGLLKKPEGDRAVRFARVMHAANEAIGDVSQAVRWLRKPNTALGGSTPLQLITSEPGTELVLAALDRIAYGGVV
jgi:putative toxin-antitoxin system antitoxin component (TIGR02293 family)